MNTNIKLLSILLLFSLIISAACNKEDEDVDDSEEQSDMDFTDSRDGQTYKYVKIGNQYWMAENLNYDAGNGNWFYENDSNNASTYGRLYEGNTACNVCPDGWHLPTDAEWTQLTDFLGGENVAGGKLKAKGTQIWSDPNAGATNEFDFSALPAGYRADNGDFWEKEYNTYYWTSTICSICGNYAYYRSLKYNYEKVFRSYESKDNAFSVRCVKD